MDKIQFEFMVRASEDETNIICITSITDLNGRTFGFPDKLQPVKLHDAILQTQIFQKVKCATLQKQQDKRQMWISVSPETKAVYCDEDGNIYHGISFRRKRNTKNFYGRNL